MGDAIQRLLEDMVPELEDLQTRGIFTAPEVKSIARKRTTFEYALRRRPADKADFLKYIEYEMNLEQLRKHRRTKMGGEHKKTSISDHSITQHIHFIFERAVRKFSDDLDLWNQYFEYCIQQDANRMLSKAFPRALSLHPNAASLWLKAAAWEYERNANIAAARVMFQRGLRLNRQSKELWLAFFSMEIRYVRKLMDRKRVLGLLPAVDTAVSTDVADPDKGPEPYKPMPASSEELEEADGDDPMEATDSAPAEEDQEADNPLRRPAKPDQPTPEVYQEETAKRLERENKERAFLSGVMPRAIFQNAISTPELAHDLSFRLSFLQLISDGPIELDAVLENHASSPSTDNTGSTRVEEKVSSSAVIAADQSASSTPAGAHKRGAPREQLHDESGVVSLAAHADSNDLTAADQSRASNGKRKRYTQESLSGSGGSPELMVSLGTPDYLLQLRTDIMATVERDFSSHADAVVARGDYTRNNQHRMHVTALLRRVTSPADQLGSQPKRAKGRAVSKTASATAAPATADTGALSFASVESSSTGIVQVTVTDLCEYLGDRTALSMLEHSVTEVLSPAAHSAPDSRVEHNATDLLDRYVQYLRDRLAYYASTLVLPGAPRAITVRSNAKVSEPPKKSSGDEAKTAADPPVTRFHLSFAAGVKDAALAMLTSALLEVFKKACAVPRQPGVAPLMTETMWTTWAELLVTAGRQQQAVAVLSQSVSGKWHPYSVQLWSTLLKLRQHSASTASSVMNLAHDYEKTIASIHSHNASLELGAAVSVLPLWLDLLRLVTSRSDLADTASKMHLDHDSDADDDSDPHAAASSPASGLAESWFSKCIASLAVSHSAADRAAVNQVKLMFLDWATSRTGGALAGSTLAAGKADAELLQRVSDLVISQYGRPSLRIYEQCIASLRQRVSTSARTAETRLLSVLEQAAVDYGKVDAGIWISYIETLRQLGRHQQVAAVYARAMKAIHPEARSALQQTLQMA